MRNLAIVGFVCSLQAGICSRRTQLATLRPPLSNSTLQSLQFQQTTTEHFVLSLADRIMSVSVTFTHLLLISYQ